VANVTSSGNTTIKPTINAAKFMGSSHAAGSALGNQVQGNTFSINAIKNILDSASLHSHIDNENESSGGSLEETNNILTDIGNALSLDFANRITEGKEEIKGIQAQKSRGKFGRAEGRLEGSGNKIGSIFKSTGSKASSPVQGIFGKIMSFLGLLGTGIAANAGFEWLKDDKNKKKLSTFFKIIQKNWKWMAGTAAILVGAKLLVDLGLAVALIGSVLATLANPVFLGVLAIAASGMGFRWMLDRINEYYADDPTGEKNFVGAPIPGAPRNALPGDFFTDTKGQTWVKTKFDSSNGGWSKSSSKPSELLKLQTKGFNSGRIKRIGRDLTGDLSVSGSGTAKITTINLPGITEGSIPQGSSTVATAVPNIAAANFSDPYRQLTPKIYGIYV